jgi:hypothetical protein
MHVYKNSYSNGMLLCLYNFKTSFNELTDSCLCVVTRLKVTVFRDFTK